MMESAVRGCRPRFRPAQLWVQSSQVWRCEHALAQAEPSQQIPPPPPPLPPPPRSPPVSGQRGSLERLQIWAQAQAQLTPTDIARVFLEVARRRLSTGASPNEATDGESSRAPSMLSQAFDPQLEAYLFDQLQQAAAREPSWPAHAVSSLCYSLQAWAPGQSLDRLLDLSPSLIEGVQEAFSRAQIAKCIYGLRRSPDSTNVRKILAALAPKVTACPDQFGGLEVGNCLYGLQHFGDSPELRAMLGALVPKIEACTESLTSQAVSNALYGLHRCGDSTESRAALAAMAPHIENCSEALTCHSLGSVFYGLKAFGPSAQLEAVLHALASKLLAYTEHLSALSISNALHGLQRCGSSTAVRNLLPAFATHICKCQDEFTQRQLAGAFYGLQRCEDTEEFRQLLAALAPQVERCQEPLSGQAIANILYGMQTGSESDELKAVLNALLKRIDGTVNFKAYELCMALHGLRSCRGGFSEALAIVGALLPYVKSCQDSFESNHLYMAFSGLQSMGTGQEVCDMLEALAPHVQAAHMQLQEQTVRCLCNVLAEVPGPESEAVLLGLRPRLDIMVQDHLIQRCLKRLASDDLPPSSAPAEHGAHADLPAGWSVHVHEGREYYHHAEHGSQWSRPGVSLPEGWVAVVDPASSRTYYHHPDHGSRWEAPI